MVNVSSYLELGILALITVLSLSNIRISHSMNHHTDALQDSEQLEHPTLHGHMHLASVKNCNDTNAMGELSVDEHDYIYSKNYTNLSWDTAPVVVKEHKLIFFTTPKVGCTTWKQLFRRINNATNWRAQNWRTGIPHDPKTNGLKYLSDYSPEEAKELMTSPEYTRAIFLRDPKERFLSAFLDKAVRDPDFLRRKCCKTTYDCVEPAQTLSGFLNLVQTPCHDAHWKPQQERMEAKYWPYINYVGHFDRLQEDSERLLRHVGAWEDYGKSGWGADGSLEIFQKASNSQEHVTHAKSKASEHFTPELERRVEDFYSVDYKNPLFKLTKKSFLSS
jgi:hypothetical protein